jgi:hypothetical protein
MMGILEGEELFFFFFFFLVTEVLYNRCGEEYTEWIRQGLDLWKLIWLAQGLHRVAEQSSFWLGHIKIAQRFSGSSRSPGKIYQRLSLLWV